MQRDEAHDEFWQLADRLISAGLVVEGTMMGHHCLREVSTGGFVATVERSSGDLIVKLPKSRVDQLVRAGDGLAFAPAGRVFKEWVRIPDRGEWPGMLEESISFISSG